MPITSVILMVLATRGLVDIWRNGSIFAELREIVSHKADTTDGLFGLPYKLLDCSYCCLPWAGFLFGDVICEIEDRPLLLGVPCGFAAAAFNYILDGLLPPEARIDRDMKLP